MYGKYGISMVLGMETKLLVWKYGFLWILNFGFYSYFWDGFVPCFWHALCHVCGMFCGLNWEYIVVGG